MATTLWHSSRLTAFCLFEQGMAKLALIEFLADTFSVQGLLCLAFCPTLSVHGVDTIQVFLDNSLYSSSTNSWQTKQYKLNGTVSVVQNKENKLISWKHTIDEFNRVTTAPAVQNNLAKQLNYSAKLFHEKNEQMSIVRLRHFAKQLADNKQSPMILYHLRKMNNS